MIEHGIHLNQFFCRPKEDGKGKVFQKNMSPTNKEQELKYM